MRAIVYHKYGPPEVLGLEEVPKPTPQDREVLVEIRAASANAADWHIIRADPFLIRLMFGGLLRPKHKIPGADIAGRVEAAGARVTQFRPGDEVFGDLSACGFGAFAEYVSAPEAALAPKPSNATFEEAAAVPLAGLAALQALRDRGRVRDGQRVLINGASGGVGTFAVQIAKSFGAHVTGVCSTRNVELVRSIGADHVVDYTREDYANQGRRYDLIVDAAAHRSLGDARRALNPGGSYVLIGGSGSRFFQAMLLGPLISRTSGVKIATLDTKQNRGDLLVLRDLVEAGKIKPVIDRRYTLSEVPDAIRYLEEGHTRGKVVITV